VRDMIDTEPSVQVPCECNRSCYLHGGHKWVKVDPIHNLRTRSTLERKGGWGGAPAYC